MPVIAYIDLEEVNTSNNPKITNVFHILSLKFLNSVGNCGVYASMAGLDLVELYTSDDSKITDFYHMQSLKKYYIDYAGLFLI